MAARTSGPTPATCSGARFHHACPCLRRPSYPHLRRRIRLGHAALLRPEEQAVHVGQLHLYTGAKGPATEASPGSRPQSGQCRFASALAILTVVMMKLLLPKGNAAGQGCCPPHPVIVVHEQPADAAPRQHLRRHAAHAAHADDGHLAGGGPVRSFVVQQSSSAWTSSPSAIQQLQIFLPLQLSSRERTGALSQQPHHRGSLRARAQMPCKLHACGPTVLLRIFS